MKLVPPSSDTDVMKGVFQTYADTLARAMALLDPYLARAERDELIEQAMQRETNE